MSSHTATMRETAAAKWSAAKPVAIGLAVGLIAGPLISPMGGHAGDGRRRFRRPPCLLREALDLNEGGPRRLNEEMCRARP
jgi:hypothetical protein